MLSIQANRYERFFILFWLSLLWYITIYRNIQTGLLFGLGPIWLWYLAHSQWKFSSFFDFLHSGAPQYTVYSAWSPFWTGSDLALGFGTKSVEIFIGFDFLHSGTQQYTVIFNLVSYLDWPRFRFGIWHIVSENFHRFLTLFTLVHQNIQ